MTAAELYALRKRWRLTQEALATRMTLQRRAYIRLETGEQTIRRAHILVLERISIDIAVERGDRTLLLPGIRYIVDRLVALDQQSI